MATCRIASSAIVLLFVGMACLLGSLHHSELWAPFAAAAHSALFGMPVPATPRLRKLQLQTGSVTTDMQAAQAQANQATSGNQQIQAVLPGVLIVDGQPVQQARCDSFTCPVNSTSRDIPETIPCLLQFCTNGDTATCCDGNWPDPEIRRVVTTTTTTTSTPKTYLPVFMMHGLGSSSDGFGELTMIIEQQHPGTIVHSIPLFQGKESFKALQTQVEVISNYIRAVVMQEPEAYSRGYNMACYSQGGLICRAIIEYMNDHNVHTFVSMAAPHMGVYGLEFFRTIIKEPFWQKWTLDNVWMIASTWILQATLSIANMWHDPFHSFSGIRHFLPKYNCLANDPYGNAQRKANFIRLQKAVFLSGRMEGNSHFDGGIEPSRSGVFEYYKEGSNTEFVPMKEQPLYVYDTFGLKTLDEQGKLEVHNPVGVFHGDWVGRPDIILKYIIPHLQ